MATPRKIPATIKEVITHSERVKSLFIEPRQKCPRFNAGQFLHLAIDHYDPSFHWPESRVFSIASSPASEIIRITFAVKGNFTKKMYEYLKPGNNIWIKLPYGDFRFEQNGNKFIFIAGGTGITPFISFLEESLNSSHMPDVHLFYGIERPEHLIFVEVIQINLERNPNFQFSLYVEENQPVGELPIRQFGRINFKHILRDCTMNEEFYLSGPEKMINLFEKNLINYKINQLQIHIDRWQ